MSGKLFTQILLALTLIFSVAIFLAALNVIGPDNIEAWAVLVAVLAVISSVVSAWSSYSVVDLQKEALKPNVTISYDFESRFGLVLLKLKNTGGTPAKNIQIKWDLKLKNHKDNVIDFAPTNDNNKVTYLSNGEEISRIIDADFKFFERYDDTILSGKISFEDLNGKTYQNSFEISAEHLRSSPNYSNESLKTEYEIQKIPKSLDKLTTQIRNLSDQLKT
jgi:hypothetical protein